jgi:hypothetical protein
MPLKRMWRQIRLRLRPRAARQTAQEIEETQS